MIYSSSEIGNSKNDSSNSVGGDKVYKGNGKELMLASLSNLYLKLEVILINTSRPSFCFILYYLLTTYTTNYCLKENVNNFDLRRLFYSKQDLKDACYFLI